MMCTLIISIGTERFGIKQPKAKIPTRPKLREAKIVKLRKELKAQRQQFRKARKEEKPALTELRNILRKKLISLRRAEWHRRRDRDESSSETFASATNISWWIVGSPQFMWLPSRWETYLSTR